VFLNARDQTFVPAASAFGLDHPSDSRSVAATDWDGDGDLDLWMANRTGPRARFLVNPLNSAGSYVALLLEGSRCNRDAIGARVQVEPVEADKAWKPLVRFVKAGDGYLAQGSRWLHFGLGDYRGKVRCTIDWPDGSRDELGPLDAGQRYRVLQSRDQETARVTQAPARSSIRTWRDEPPAEPRDAGTARVVAHEGLPMPTIPWVRWDGSPVNDLERDADRPCLVVLWASWCQPCIQELSRLQADAERWRREGLQWTTLNLDDWDQPIEARRAKVETILKSWSSPLPGGLATPAAIEALDVVQRVLVSHQEPMPLPMSLLLDDAGRVAVVYKGAPDEATLLADLRRVQRHEPATWRDFALPFPGRWYIQPAPPDLLAIPTKLLELERPDASFRYLLQHIPPPGTRVNAEAAAKLSDEDLPGDDLPADSDRNARPPAAWYELFRAPLADAYLRTGVALAQQRQFEAAQASLQGALRCDAGNYDALAALASLYGATGQPGRSLAVYQKMLALQPQDLSVANNVAWLMATSRDASVRNPEQAVQVAEKVCRLTQRRMPATLDTLAAAYAAAGRFDEAIRTVEEAIEKAGPDSQQLRSLREHLQQYQRKQPHLE